MSGSLLMLKSNVVVSMVGGSGLALGADLLRAGLAKGACVRQRGIAEANITAHVETFMTECSRRA